MPTGWITCATLWVAVMVVSATARVHETTIVSWYELRNGKTVFNLRDVHLDGLLAAEPGSEQDFIVNIGDRVFFESGAWILSPASVDTIKRQAAWLKVYKNVQVTLSAHTDEVEWRKFQGPSADHHLSLARALAVRDVLVEEGVIPPRIKILSAGWWEPVALCDAESCWSQNRRVVTVVHGSKKH